MRKLDMVGRRFGRLTVVEFAGLNEYKIPHRMWRCRCECGTEIVKSGPRLYAGKVKSCGCLNLEHMRSIPLTSRLNNLQLAKNACVKPGAAFRELLYDYKRNAAKRGLDWKLTEHQFKTLTQQACFYTGTLPASRKVTDSGEVFIYNGIDRLDSSQGYTPDNCVACCGAVNRMKVNMDFFDFINLCDRVHSYLASREVRMLTAS